MTKFEASDETHKAFKVGWSHGHTNLRDTNGRAPLRAFIDGLSVRVLQPLQKPKKTC